MASFKHITALGEEKERRIQELLRRGEGTTTVAAMIQGDWGDLTEMKPKSLEKMLTRYKTDRIIAPAAVALETGLIKAGAFSAAKQTFDVLSEMEGMAAIQKGRILQYLANEQKLQVPNSQTKHEIETYFRQLEAIKKTQFDLGLVEFKGPLPSTMIRMSQDAQGNQQIEFSLSAAVQDALKVIEGEYTVESADRIPE